MVASLSDLYGNDSPTGSFQEIINKGSVLITGAQGLIGNAVAQLIYHAYFIESNSEATIYLASRSWTLESQNYWSTKTHVKLIRNDDIPLLEDLEIVVHAASPSNIVEITTIDSLRFANLELAKKILKTKPRKIVFISTSEVYGGLDIAEGSRSQCLKYEVRRDWYPLVKLETEDYLTQEAQKQNLNLVIIRLFHTFGPGIRKNDGRSFADFIYNAARNETIILKSKGQQIRTYMYVTDAAEVILNESLNFENKITVMNLGSLEPISIYDFAMEVAGVSNTDVKIHIQTEFEHSPNNKIIPKLDYLSSKAYIPKTSRKLGIYRTIKWIKAQN